MALCDMSAMLALGSTLLEEGSADQWGGEFTALAFAFARCRGEVHFPRGSQGCSEVRPVEGRSCSAALKSEGRRPNRARPRSSDFGPRPSFGLRPSGFGLQSLRSSGLGFGMARTDFRAALREPPCLGSISDLPGVRPFSPFTPSIPMSRCCPPMVW